VGVKVCVAVGVKVGVDVGVEVGGRGVPVGLGSVGIKVGRGVFGKIANPRKTKNKRQNSKTRTARILSCKYVIPKNLLLDPFEDGSIHEPLILINPAKKSAKISATACILVGNLAHIYQGGVILPNSPPHEKRQYRFSGTCHVRKGTVGKSPDLFLYHGN
jgi:hypothetical protein